MNLIANQKFVDKMLISTKANMMQAMIVFGKNAL